MSNVSFDGKLLRRVVFTKAFKASISSLATGTVIIFTGPERDATSAAATLLTGLKLHGMYHDAKDVLLGVLSWSSRESGLYESFRFSVDSYPVVALGYVDKEFALTVNSDKCAKFRLWLRQALKRRTLAGRTTIMAAPEPEKESSLATFFGRDVIEQCGLIVRTNDVIEEE